MKSRYLIDYIIGIFMYKVYHCKIPKIFETNDIENPNIHAYITSKLDLIHIAHADTNQRDMAMQFQGGKVWNYIVKHKISYIKYHKMRPYTSLNMNTNNSCRAAIPHEGIIYPLDIVQEGTLQVLEHLLIMFKIHWGRVTHIYISKLTSIGSDTGQLPGRCQAIIWTNVGILFIGPLETNFSEIIIKIYTFSFKKMHLKMLSGKCWPFCLGLNELKVANDL